MCLPADDDEVTEGDEIGAGQGERYGKPNCNGRETLSGWEPVFDTTLAAGAGPNMIIELISWIRYRMENLSWSSEFSGLRCLLFTQLDGVVSGAMLKKLVT